MTELGGKMLLGLSLILLQGMNPIVASAVIPGLGEMLQGETGKARAFMIIEGSIWLSYFGFKHFGNKLEQSARVFAVNHAQANPARLEKDYYDALESYSNSYYYNLIVEREASYLYPDDPVRQQEYIERNGYFGDDAWQWNSLTNRTEYWQKRKASRENLRRASFMPGFAIINRIVSIIDVIVFAEEERFGLDTDPGRIGILYRF